MKKKLLLETVLKLKADVEKMIENSYDSIVKYNLTEKKVDNLLARIDKLEAQLIHFKEVIQEANKSKIGGKTNYYNIYYLSNQVAKKKFYETLERALNRAPVKANTAQIKSEVVTTQLKKLGEKITEFQNKLSVFNAKKKVTVYLDESLDLL